MYDVIVIGAGAAGLMAAGTAASSGLKVLLLEKMEKAGRKIRITGKGRCNITNNRPAEEFLSKVRANVDFFRPSFDYFDNRKTIAFFRTEGLRLEIERGERVFPESGKAWDVADTLVDWAVEAGVEILYNCEVTRIVTIADRVTGVKYITKRGFERSADSRNIIVCTGGVSYPATGSTGDGYRFAHELGHRIEEVRPSLVPLETAGGFAEKVKGLKLKNTTVRLLVDGEIVREEFGELEFTRRGIEGAVILRLSCDAVDALIEGKSVSLSLDFKPPLDAEILTARIERELGQLEGNAPLGELLRKLMPKPMVAPFAEEVGLAHTLPVSELSDEEKQRIISVLKGLEIGITDYRPFEEAVVTAGGVGVEDVDPETLQSKLVRGLYFAGEVLDIDADTGGYNLQVAFSTGRLAGKLRGR